MSFLYPPILSSTYPAFLATNTNLTIPYSFSKMMDDSEVKHIDIIISRLRDNFNLVTKNSHPDGIIYLQYIQGDPHEVTISIADLVEPWTPNEIYKILLRFGKGELWDDFPNITTDWTTWHERQISEGLFGEWSNVMLIKAINMPTITGPYVIDETELLPTIYGSCASDDGEEFYQFSIMRSHDLIEESNWIRHTDYIDAWTPNIPLLNETKYTLIYRIETVNGFITEQLSILIPYSSDVTKLSGITIEAASDEEEGYIQVSIVSENALTGNYILSRSEDLIHWEKIHYFLSSENYELQYKDYCIESGVQYYYGFLYENTFHYCTYRNVIAYPVSCHFQHSYLYANGVLLKLTFDNKINSFKHTTLTSKQDTLGSKYPTILRNGYAYYGEFSLNGLISYHMNSDNFFSIRPDGLYYRDELVIRNRKNKEGYYLFPTEDGKRGNLNYSYEIDTNLSGLNIYIERKFREKVEEFLNDGGYKLFKSPTEGTMIVTLTNVLLLPNETVHRLISNFSATAYEVADFNRENLLELGLEDTGSWKDITNADYVKMAGSILVDDDLPVLLITTIRTTLAEELKIFHSLTSFWVDGVDPDTILLFTLVINNNPQKIFVMPGRTYYINDIIADANLTEIEADSSMNFNYICDYNVQEDPRLLRRIFSYSGIYLFPATRGSFPWEILTTIATTKIGQALLRSEQYAFNDPTITEISSGHYINNNSTLEFYETDTGLEWIEFTGLTPDIPMIITIGDLSTQYIPAPANSTMRFYPHRDNITAISFITVPVGILVEVKMNFIGYEYTGD